MKTCLSTFIFLACLLGMAAAAFAQMEPPAEIDLLNTPEPFSLITSADDSPGLARKKAALRLVRGYHVTLGQLHACRPSHQEAGKAMGTYSQRNGNTLALSMKVVNEYGGMTPEIRSVLDTEVADSLASAGDCQAFIKDVNSGSRDIYKAPQFQNDYKLVQSKAKP